MFPRPQVSRSRSLSRLQSRQPEEQTHFERSEKVKAINPYLNFDGKTAEAMKFYAACLDAKLQMQTFKEMERPDQFWGARFGMIVDQFGVNWMFNYDNPKS